MCLGQPFLSLTWILWIKKVPFALYQWYLHASFLFLCPYPRTTPSLAIFNKVMSSTCLLHAIKRSMQLSLLKKCALPEAFEVSFNGQCDKKLDRKLVRKLDWRFWFTAQMSPPWISVGALCSTGTGFHNCVRTWKTKSLNWLLVQRDWIFYCIQK